MYTVDECVCVCHVPLCAGVGSGLKKWFEALQEDPPVWR